jgi:16S rRNA (adenine1518-N6/adenine1519-N6)-dimethyltransferase
VTLTSREVHVLLERHGVTPSRALGQNFVVDPNTVRRIARLADVGPDDRVLEIGAGLGSLTLALTETGAEVTALEVDRHLLPALRESVAATSAEVVQGDALEMDWGALLGTEGPVVVVANLPYNIATPLILRLLDEAPMVQRLLVMVQAEVGHRLVAGPGSKAYGIPSIRVAYHAHAEIAGVVPPTVFLPQPKVESSLVAMTRLDEPAVDVDPAMLFGLVRRAFGQRRKMLRRSLELPPGVYESAGIDQTSRPEQLDLQAWARLTRAVASA